MKFHRLDTEPPEQAPLEPDELFLGICSSCGARWQGEAICHCTTCHMTFTAIGGFDAHRYGSHEHDTRRCYNPDQMKARGYEPNERGHWRKPGTDEWWQNENHGNQ